MSLYEQRACGIQRNMQTSDSPRYPSGEASHPILDKGVTDAELRALLEQLISSSEELNVRVWLDGVYTDIDNTEVRGDWMNGREVYFKVEGRVDSLRKGADR